MVALISTTCVTMIIAVVAACFSNGLDILSSMVNIGALVAFFMLHLSVIKYLKKENRNVLRHRVIPVLGAIIICYVIYQSSHLAQLLACLWLITGVMFMLVSKKYG